MEGDANSATASGDSSRRVFVPDGLTNDFVSDVIVYRVERVESDLGKSRNAYAKRYLSRDIWFKVLLNIDTNGHCGNISPLSRPWGGAGGWMMPGTVGICT